LVDDFFHCIHAAQSSKTRIVQGVFDLSHPETGSAFNAVVHFANDRFNQFSIRCNASHSRTQSF